MVNLATFSIPDELLAAARQGDFVALSSLWDVCAPLVTLAVRQNPVPPETLDRSDVAQRAAELFLRAVQGDEGGSAARLTDYLRRRLAHQVYSYLRSERRRLGHQVIAQQDEVERALTRRHRSPGSGGPPGRSLARALERLTPRQRAVIDGLYFSERNRQAIASELSVTAKSVTAIQRRALATLRAALAEDAGCETSDCPGPDTTSE
ncbi:MAG TPA: sigma-70 family RNA polymerase sigma factor [Chloroflexota bacterium]|nr:sigma-70 family RNA polymerase sigma factor [Chloroflexota bacterium]